MRCKSQSSAIQPLNLPVPEPVLDPESFFTDAVWFFKHALEEKLSSGVSFQTLMSESNEELATLLEEVHTPPDAELGSILQARQNNRAPDARRSLRIEATRAPGGTQQSGAHR